MAEASESTLRTDLMVNSLIYARIGLPEYWVIDINARALHVFRQPGPDGYASQTVLTDAETVSPLESRIPVADLLP